jgi:hypothetical protein
MSKDDSFWSYWKLNGSWSFQNSGANYSRVEDREVEGWEFGHGTSSLPQITFEQICQKAEKDESTTSNDTVVQSQENDKAITSEQIIASQTSTSAKSLLKESTATMAASPVQTETQYGMAMKGDGDQKSLSEFPEFNLKNISILFLIFIACGAIFIFIKLAVKKICK